MNDFLHAPLCKAADLGKPIPPALHAVSVCLPLWRHNIGYEEADPAVVNAMQSGYPRFFVHPLAARLFALCERRFADPDECCFAFPSPSVAQRCAQFVARATGRTPTVHPYENSGIFAVCLPRTDRDYARAYWQHTGEIVSSRQAADALELTTGQHRQQSPAHVATAAAEAEAVTRTLRERVAGILNAEPDDVFLFPTGMAAIFCLYRAAAELAPKRKSVQFGFPYVDTLKILEKFGPGVHFYPQGNEAELQQLAQLAGREPLTGLFCEFPSNPLLTSPNLRGLLRLARERRFPLFVDDTLGALVNVDVLPAADAVTTSLTKYFSGRGDVMGGSLALNRRAPHYTELRASVMRHYEDLLYPADAAVLEHNSRDATERVACINQTAETLCEMIRSHRAVERVNYPKYVTADNYNAFRTPGGGYGGLFSFLLRDAAKHTPAFFDALAISKGPNLGTNFSLCCPYTLLAHYRELEFVESCGISRYLLRVSVGLEEPAWLLDRFRTALDQLPV